MDTEPSLRLGYVTSIPDEAVQPLIDALAGEGLTPSIDRREPPGPFAMLEWFIPSAVAIFAAKSYFDGFLKEAGKDHYAALKKGIAALWPGFFGPEATVRLRLVASAPNKVSAEPIYSIALSVMAEAGERKVFKLLLRNDSSQQDLETAVAAFLVFVERFHANTLEPEQRAKLDALQNFGGMFIVACDRATNSIEILDPRPKRS